MESASAPIPPNRKSQARASQACQMCRLKKAKCDQTMPCSNCDSHGWICGYEKKIRSGGRKRSHTESNTVAMVPGSQALSVFLPTASRASEASGASVASEAYNSIPEPQNTSSTRSKERTINTRNEASGRYSSYHKENESPGGEIDTLSSKSDQEIEPLRDINEHTTGREYYGRSSNFALLVKLFAYTRSSSMGSGRSGMLRQSNSFITKTGSEDSLRPYRTDSTRPAVENLTARTNTSASDRLSIINLLYDDGISVAEPNITTPRSERARPVVSGSMESRADTRDMDPNEIEAMDDTNPMRLSDQEMQANSTNPHGREAFPTDQASDNFGRSSLEMVIEKEYLRLFFTNLYYIHPFLSQAQFSTRCQTTIWSRWPLNGIPRGEQHFVALYNVILAVGSLTGSPDTFVGFKEQLNNDLDASHSDMSCATSSTQLSRIFFDRSKRLLGDFFEVCTLESAQTLILMSLYWQNHLKPHACYMYSGMAVRTALAIGLPDSSMPQSVDWRNSARKTWWAIYSQEVDMCCSSGRMSSLMSPQSYDISFPQTNGITTSASSNTESKHVAIITEMAKFAALLLRVSKEIYHEVKHASMLQKSKVAFELDSCFTDWRNNLPSWLGPDSNALKEPEWVGKQKLVLELRYQNAKILLHRPFVAASAAQQPREFGANVDACLTAARCTISLLYESYSHRHYFRSWRYNTTYTIYAATIILYLILLDYSAVSTKELLADIDKALEILSSMDEARVARRCFRLIQELLEFAQSHIQQRSRLRLPQDTSDASYPNALQSPLSRYETNSGGVESNQGFWSSAQSNLNATPLANDRSMTEMWASMMDPIALEELVAGDELIDGMTYGDSWFGGNILQ